MIPCGLSVAPFGVTGSSHSGINFCDFFDALQFIGRVFAHVGQWRQAIKARGRGEMHYLLR